MPTVNELLNTLPQRGEVCWLGIRPVKRAPLKIVDAIEIDESDAIVGDHFSGQPGAKRQVSLIQYEHIDAVGSILGKTIQPEWLRRNIVISGINLQSLKEKHFLIGNAVLFGTANCPPCSRMEENLGPGGYNAMRGHGGITARVVRSGTVKIGDVVEVYRESI